MKAVFYASDKPREIMLARAFESGIRLHGDDFELRRTAEYGEDRKYEGPSPDTDIAIFFGVKGKSAEIMKEHVALGKHALYLDKGYTRQKGEGNHTLYTRFAIDGPTPLKYFQREKHRHDRLEKLNFKILERRKPTSNGHILFCGSSQKYHDFNSLGDAIEYAEKALFKLRKASDRQIVYRPKPSWTDAEPLPNFMFSNGSQDILDALRGCHALVTHGSSVAVTALLMGIPIVVLGETVMSPVAESDLTKVDNPFWPTNEQRWQWACDFAYCQWTIDEMRNGEAWSNVRRVIA